LTTSFFDIRIFFQWLLTSVKRLERRKTIAICQLLLGWFNLVFAKSILILHNRSICRLFESRSCCCCIFEFGRWYYLLYFTLCFWIEWDFRIIYFIHIILFNVMICCFRNTLWKLHTTTWLLSYWKLLILNIWWCTLTRFHYSATVSSILINLRYSFLYFYWAHIEFFNLTIKLLLFWLLQLNFLRETFLISWTI
jgi:hypothetical protein